jgi:hypothetical protein
MSQEIYQPPTITKRQGVAWLSMFVIAILGSLSTGLIAGQIYDVDCWDH